MAGWTTRDIPDQSGRTVLVTGGNAGLGYQTARELARRGARVLLAARDRARGAAALERLGTEAPASHAELATNLQVAGPRSGGTNLAARGMSLATRLFAQPARDGALPQLYAATAESVHGGEYFGPDGPGELRGRQPKLVAFSPAARDNAAAARLWAVSEELTGVTFEALTTP